MTIKSGTGCCWSVALQSMPWTEVCLTVSISAAWVPTTSSWIRDEVPDRSDKPGFPLVMLVALCCIFLQISAMMNAADNDSGHDSERALVSDSMKDPSLLQKTGSLRDDISSKEYS